MRVFHFLNKKYGIKDIKERRLKIATIMELNDPFELLCLNLSNQELRCATLKTKEDLSKTIGLLCFSKNWSNPVQWAHHADKHKGLCLGFDVPVKDFLPVIYSSKRLSREADKIINGGIINQDLMLKLLTIKFYHWHYEKESRSFIRLKDKDKDSDGFYYSDFSDKLILKQIIVGSNSDITRTNINKVLGDDINEVEIFKVRPAFNSFRIVRNKNEALWA